MTLEQIKATIQNEIDCIEKATNGCDKRCSNCDLFLNQTIIHEAFKQVIEVLDKIEKCDEKSATKCWSCINLIKEVIEE